MENIRMYPPRRVTVSNPFIMETSRKAPDELETGVFFFLSADKNWILFR